jgi:hypothetical protein
VAQQQPINGRVRHGAAEHRFVRLPNRFDRDSLPVPVWVFEGIQEFPLLGQREVLPPTAAHASRQLTDRSRMLDAPDIWAADSIILIAVKKKMAR